MVDNENMCKVITSGYCPYADGVDEDVKVVLIVRGTTRKPNRDSLKR